MTRSKTSPVTTPLRCCPRVVGGHVDVLVDALATLLPLHREGKIKILANFDDVRSPVAPEIATFVLCEVRSYVE